MFWATVQIAMPRKGRWDYPVYPFYPVSPVLYSVYPVHTGTSGSQRQWTFDFRGGGDGAKKPKSNIEGAEVEVGPANPMKSPPA